MTDRDQEIFDGLAAPFPTYAIEWRVGSTTKDKSKGMALAYINARTVMDRFDAVCGCGGWQVEHYPAGGERMACKVGVLLSSGWVWKSDGAGETDFEAEKGAFSSALKRAAVLWGVGRYLYDLDAPWVELKDGRYIPDAELKKLSELHEKAISKVGWGERSGVYAYRMLLQVIKDTVTQPSDVPAFLEKHKSMIPQLPVAMRRHLHEQLDRIGGRTQEAA